MKKFFRALFRFIGRHTGFLLFLTIAITGISCLIYANVSLKKVEEGKKQDVSYQDFLTLVNEGKVDAVWYTGSGKMRFALFNEDTKSMSKKDRENYSYPQDEYIRTDYPSYLDFKKDMLEQGVRAIYEPSPDMSGASSFIYLGLVAVLLLIMIKAMNSNGAMPEKSLVVHSKVRFSDVIGQDEIMTDLTQVTQMVRDPEKSKKLGGRLPAGVLLYGAPGTGKTLIAKAIAGEAGVPFLYKSASEFIEMFVGMGAKRIRQLFSVARKMSAKHGGCIIFIDEIDAIGGKRGASGRNSEDDKAINALLTEMDGMNGKEGIFVIAATNRLEDLDAALTRAGRFDRQIAVNLPRNARVREKMFSHYLKRVETGEIDIPALAKETAGFSGADISSVVNEAALIAGQKNRDGIEMVDIEEAIDKKVFKGNRINDSPFEEDERVVAYHEAGHAIETYLCGLPIARATVQGTTSGVGGAVFRGDTDSLFLRKEELKAHIKIAYAGRASEEIKFSDVTSGASNDIEQATNTIMRYIGSYGFDEEIGLVDLNHLIKSGLSDNTALLEKVKSMSKTLYQETKDDLKKNYTLVTALAEELLIKGSMTGSEIMELLKTTERS